jgi:NADPH-dependent ferric siderophore reductase
MFTDKIPIMPSVPKWLGDTVETVFSSQIHPVTVSEITYLGEKLKHVRFQGDLTGTDFLPGQVVQLRVSDTEYRHYTPSYFDRERGICEVLFYLHGKGPGSKWADNLKKGQVIKLRGPGGRLRYNVAAKYHFMFGDETSIGLFQCIKEAVNRNGQEYLCILELENEFANWPDFANLSAEVVSKTCHAPGSEAISILYSVSTPESVFWDVWKDATFYLAGRAKSVQSFRKELRKRGISGKQIRTEPYWEEGKRGM